MDKHQKKRAIISAIWVIIFAMLIWGVYSLLKPDETCSDGVKNQNEEEIDCGGVCPKCQKIEVRSLTVIKGGFTESGIAGKYDLWSIVKNPNNSFGSRVFSYEIVAKDAQGRVLAVRNGKGFILPGEEKYVIESNVESPTAPTVVGVRITSSDWIQFNEAYEKPDIRVVNKQYNNISSGTEFSEAKGLVRNESPYDFNTLTVLVILKDKDRNVIATNSTQMNTVRAGEARDFRITWPNRFPGEVSDMETQVDVNVFDSQNFIKKYYKSEQFSSY